ncbi:MAG: stage II sporulation protein D [Oscillospiraceae bacterium]|nr:stage II sporulation protein D [Oscillospiraceae bacterium]
MKSYTLLCFFLSLAMILCPLCSVERATDVISQELFGESADIEESETDVMSTVKIMSAESKNITEMSLREYLIGTVAAEMSLSYHEEAIKAQVIASHTLLEHSRLNKSEEIGEADITDNSQTHQGYIDTDTQKEKWGDNYSKYREKIEKCVDEVINLIIQYDGEPITAAFHAISNGKTENASDVWGGTYPYLISVESAGDKLSPAYSSELTVSVDEFKSIMEKQDATLSDDPNSWIRDTVKTETGMVKEITVGDKTFKGSDIRSFFSLKSSTFDCKYDNGSFSFTVSGYGHGVGMSQYGADFMARQGLTYKEILQHYYPGTQIV